MTHQLAILLGVFAVALVATFTLIKMMMDEAIDFGKSGVRSNGMMFIIVIKKLVVTALWCYFVYLLKTN